MAEDATPQDQIAALLKEIEALKEQVFVLTDKANQALIASEAQSAIVLALIAQSKDRKFLLERFNYLSALADQSKINMRRTDFEKDFQSMVRENFLAHLQQR